MDDDWSDFYVSKPRYRLAAGSSSDDQEGELDNNLASLTVPLTSVGVVLLAVAFILLPGGMLQFLVLWLALSLIVGPHAPRSVTGGDCRIGVGPKLVEESPDGAEIVESEELSNGTKGSKQNGQGKKMPGETVTSQKPSAQSTDGQKLGDDDGGATDTADAAKDNANLPSGWTEEDVQRLQRARAKYPRGTARRWEVIAQAMGGRKSMEDIVKLGRQMQETTEKKGAQPVADH